MGKGSQKEVPTLKAVLAYAARLRQVAEEARAGDPNVDLYAPSDAAARKVCQEQCNKHGNEHGPGEALRVLAGRAKLAELKIHEDQARANKARARHLPERLIAAGERQAERSRLSLGARLDRALQDLQTVSEVSAVRLDGDRVRGGDKARMPRLNGKLDRDAFAAHAAGLVADIESAVDAARRRMAEVQRAS